jgi:hypothetical protein
MIGITGIYLVLGGYFAITLTDFIQGITWLSELSHGTDTIIKKWWDCSKYYIGC